MVVGLVALQERRKSLCPQRVDRVYQAGTPRRDETSKERDARKNDRSAGEQHGIARRNLIQLRRDKTAKRKCADDAEHEPDHHRRHSLTHDETKHIRGLRAERHADSDFAGALLDAVSDGAINADRGQHKGYYGKRA